MEPIKYSAYDPPFANLKEAGFKDEPEFSDVLASEFLSEIEKIIGSPLEKNKDPDAMREITAGDDFKADIVCNVLETDEDENSSKSLVIIENQFGRSNHKHLGQCVTYASNKSAKAVIWICEELKPAHANALRWLNKHFGSEVGFYGIVAEAHKFQPNHHKITLDVIVEPDEEIFSTSDWRTPRRNKRDELYRKVQEKYNEISSMKLTKPNRAGSPHFVLPRKKQYYFYWHHLAASAQIVSELKLKTVNDNVDNMMKMFRILQQNKEKIESVFPNVIWRDPDDPDVHQDRPSIRIPVSVPKKLEDISDEEMEKVSEKLADDMKKLADLAAELKL